MANIRADPLQQTQKKFEDFCVLPNLLLYCYNLDFPIKPRSQRSRMLRNLYFCLAVVAHLYILTFIAKSILNMLTSSDYELSSFLHILSGFSYGLFGILKCLAFCWNAKHCRKIFDVLQEIYPKTRQQQLCYEIQKYFWPKWVLFIVYLYLEATVFIIASPIVESIILYIVDIFKVGRMQTEFAYHKLYEIEYSFDHQSLIRYSTTYLLEALHAQFMIVFNMCSNIWLLCFTLQLCMHFDNIARRLENYEPNEKTYLKDQAFISQVVQRHQQILNLSECVKKSFGLLLLLEVMSIAVTLCSASVYCLTQGLSRELVEHVAFLPTAIGQYFLICYFGQLLIIKSGNMAEAAYNNTWYNGSRSYKKYIFFISMRARKVVQLNALGVQPICLEAFQMVMGATYRLFALLKETML